MGLLGVLVFHGWKCLKDWGSIDVVGGVCVGE